MVLVIVTALMTVYRIVLVHGVAILMMMSVVCVIVTALMTVCRIVMAHGVAAL